MVRGKQTCKILKEIRRQIAEANDIEFITSECQYQGDCLGTCPKCEAEVRYLEQQLERKQISGATNPTTTGGSSQISPSSTSSGVGAGGGGGGASFMEAMMVSSAGVGTGSPIMRFS